MGCGNSSDTTSGPGKLSRQDKLARENALTLEIKQLFMLKDLESVKVTDKQKYLFVDYSNVKKQRGPYFASGLIEQLKRIMVQLNQVEKCILEFSGSFLTQKQADGLINSLENQTEISHLEFRFRANKLKTKIGSSIKNLLNSNTNMKHFQLELKGNLFNRFHFDEILDELQKSKDLHTLILDLGGTLCPPKHLTMIGEFIKKHQNIKTLDLQARYNEIEDHSITKFSEALNENQSIDDFTLQASFCDLTNDGINTLSKCLLEDPKYKKVSIHFWYNRDIDNDSCREIGRLLETNSTLESFKLTLGLNKGVNNKGFNKIIYALDNNKSQSLKTLWLNFRYTQIDNKVTKEIANYLISAKNLQDINFHLSETKITPLFEKNIKAHLENFKSCKTKVYNQEKIS